MILRVFLATAFMLCGQQSLAHQAQEQEATEQPSATVDLPSAIAAALAKHESVERAYLVHAPDSNQLTLALIFVKKYDGAAVSDAMSTYARLAPNLPPLNIYLPARKTWKRSFGGIEPIYVRP